MLISDARANGADIGNKESENRKAWCDMHELKPVDSQDFALKLISRTAYEIATNNDDEREQLIRSKPEEAAADAPNINAYKVTHERGLHGTVHVGTHAIRFVRDISYLSADHGVLRWFQKGPAYRVEPVFAVPEDWQNQEELLNMDTDHTGFQA